MTHRRAFVGRQLPGELIILLDDGGPVRLLGALEFADTREMFTGLLAGQLGLAFVVVIVHHADGEQQPEQREELPHRTPPSPAASSR